MINENDKLSKFGRRLLEVANKRGCGNTGAMAHAIFYNTECRRIVKIREHKDYKNPFEEKEAIRRNIQNHLTSPKYDNVWKVPSQYMYAYSVILDCSIDYLYGKTDIMSSDLGVVDICQKTGLSEDAVNCLVANKIEMNDEGAFSYTTWWSELLNDDSFFYIPMSWLDYARRIVEINDLNRRIEAVERASAETVNEGLDIVTRLLLNDDNQKTLKNIRKDKEDTMLGAHHKMMFCIEHFLNQYADEWAAQQHPNFGEMYYKSEINKRKVLKEYEKHKEI